MSGRINVDDVLAGLRAIAVLDHYGARYHDEPQIRLRECPRCRARSRREAIVVNRATGAWVHHSGASAADAPCKGDILELVAAFEGLDRTKDFRRLLEVAAPIAGLLPGIDDTELSRRREARQREDEAYAREAAERRARAQAAIPATWQRLDKRSIAGERYLAGRGLDPRELIARGVVRFAPCGDPSVLLHDFNTGAPINILRRRVDGAEPKVLATDDCSTDGTIIGRVAELDREGPDIAVIAEGMTDAIAAVLAFPGCVVLGANGASKLVSAAAAAASRIREIRGLLVIAPDDDEVGIESAAQATRIAMDAGLRLVVDEPSDDGGANAVTALELGPHKDLAAAWQAGWRWWRFAEKGRAS